MLERDQHTFNHYGNIVSSVTGFVKEKPVLEFGDTWGAYEHFVVDKAAVTNFMIRARVPAFITATVHENTHWQDTADIYTGFFQTNDGKDNFAIEVTLKEVSPDSEIDELTHILTLYHSGENTIETICDRYDYGGDRPYDQRPATDQDIQDFSTLVSNIKNAIKEESRG